MGERDQGMEAGSEPGEQASGSESPPEADAPAQAAGDKAAGEGAATAGKAADEGAATGGGGAAKAASAPAPKAAPRSDRASSIIGPIVVLVFLGVLAWLFVARQNDEEPAVKAAPTAERHRSPPWTVGSKVPVTITVLPTDAENLDCASPTEINGKHCAFEAQNKKWSKGESTDDKVLLRPYATVDRQRLIAAGFWSGLPQSLPAKRFSATCTFEIQGQLVDPLIRYSKERELKKQDGPMMAGVLSGCAVVAEKGK